MTTSLAVSWDYRCPFARNAHEHLLSGLDAGADWNVTFIPFSLGQAHVAEGEPSIFELPEGRRELFALAAGVTTRDHYPDAFPAVHRALFAARHDQGRDLREEDVVKAVLSEQGLDAEAIASRYDHSVAKVREEHGSAVEDHRMFGVPTFVCDGRAVFVRLTDRPGGDSKRGTETIEGILRILDQMPALNEFKFTTISR